MTGSSTMTDAAVAQVLRCTARAPHFSWDRGWHLVADGHDWLVLASGERSRLTQAQVVSAGSTAQLLVLGRESRSRRSVVEVLPRDRPDCVVAVRDAGPVSPARATQLLDAAEPDERHDLGPETAKRLNLTAEAFGCELLWQDETGRRSLTPGLRRVSATADSRPLTTVVTRGDGPADWVAAGRAVAQVDLRARELGLVLAFGVHALGSWVTREDIRRLWQLSCWPQVQFWVELGPSRPPASEGGR